MALKNRKNNDNKFKFDLNTTILDLMISYAYSTNESVSLKGITNLHNFINHVDASQYDNLYEISIRLSMLKLTLIAIVEKRIREFELIKGYVETNLGSEGEKEDMKIIFEALEEFGEMSNADIEYINDYVAERLTNIHLYKHQNELRECLESLESGNCSISTLNKKFDKLVSMMYKDIRSTKSACEGSSSMDFSFRNESTLEYVTEKTIRDLNKPANFVKTGIKRLNNMLGGGFESGRCYVVLGMPKKFKSGFLLNSALWGAKYNKDIMTKDPTKKPCVVYISMENSTKETLGRIYHYCSSENIKNYKTREAMDVMVQELSVEGSEVDLVIWYRPNRSINTMDLDALLDDLAAEGKECVMLVQDYLVRIRPLEMTGETRIDLGNATNDFTVIAKQRDIPVVTAMQLNREAMKILENCQLNNKSDIAKQLGSSNTGESINIIQNCDCAFIVNKEYSTIQDMSYLTFRLVACRYHETEDTYFAHPFVKGNGMRLREDIRLAKSESVDSISSVTNNINPNTAPTESNGNPRFKNASTKKKDDYFGNGGKNINNDDDFDDI